MNLVGGSPSPANAKETPLTDPLNRADHDHHPPAAGNLRSSNVPAWIREPGTPALINAVRTVLTL
jgi:hypothetical protein